MLRLIDRYVLRQVVPPFLLGLIVFTFILEIPFIIELAEDLIAKGVPTTTILRIMVTLLPQALGLTIPMAGLLGLLMGLGRLSGDREAVALQACGVSTARLLRPVLFFSAVGWAATSYIMIVALPEANQTFREIRYNIVASRVENEVKPRVFFEDFPNLVFYVREVPTDQVGWRDVFVADTENPEQPVIFVAQRGRMVLDREAHRVELLLLDGTRHRLTGESPEGYEVLQFKELHLALNPDTVFPQTGPQRGSRELSIPELRQEVERLREEGLSPHGPIMEIQKKFSIPVACFVFGVIGLALGITGRRDGKLASFVLGIVVIFAYYVFMYTGEAMAKGHLVPPELAMWLPNIFLGAAGFLLLFRRSSFGDSPLAFRIPGFKRRVPVSTAAERDTRDARTPKRTVVVVRVPQFNMPGPSLLDAYVSRTYVRVIVVAFVGMLGIFYISTFIDLSDKLFKGQTTGWMLLEYFWYQTPQYVYYVLPIAALIATLVTIGVLTKNSELVVMKACGISLYRVAVPLVMFAVLWSGCLFLLGETVLAYANRRAEAIRHVIRGGAPRTYDILNRRWIVGENGSIYHYMFFDPQKNELNDFSVYELDLESWRMVRRIFATQVAYDGNRWTASAGWVRAFEPSAQPTDYTTFDHRELPLEQPSYFATERPAADRMTYLQLKHYIAQLQASGFHVVPHLVALQRKLSFPFVTLIMTLIAVPFAVTTGRHGALYGIGAGIVLAISYWVITSVFAAIGSAGLVAPVLAAWSPNVLFASGALYLLLTVRT